MYTVEEAIANLSEEIAEKQEQITQLQRFGEIAKCGLTEQEYHNFCETDLRYSDVLGKSLLTVFSFLEYEKRGANWFFYRLDEVQVCIPNSRCMGIDIVMPNLIPDFDKRKNTIQQNYWLKPLDKKIQLYQQYLQTKSFVTRAKLMFPTYRTPFAVIKFVMLGRQASDKEMKRKLDEATEERAKLEEKIQQKINEATEMFQLQKKFFDKYIPLFLEWTETIRIQTALDSCISMKFQRQGE